VNTESEVRKRVKRRTADRAGCRHLTHCGMSERSRMFACSPSCAPVLSSEPMHADSTPITSPHDPRLKRMGKGDVAGEDQIAQMLALPPRERLRCLLDMLDFETRAQRAHLVPKER
jgi:hypothetical protein